MEAGRAIHRGINIALPHEGAFEVRLRRRGVSARIDLLAEVPVEIKTGEDPLPGDLKVERPEYVEQVGFYCALLDRDEARLVHVQRLAQGAPKVRAYDLGFRDPGALGSELEQRATSLREAIALREPSRLPRCRWFSRGCEYRAAGQCDCQGTEPPPSDVLLAGAKDARPREDVAERWASALERIDLGAPSPSVRRYRDLVYPRRAYFDAVSPLEASGPPVAVTDSSVSDVWDGAVGALEGGPAGEVHRLREFGWTPEEEVAGWRGEPYVLRTSRAWSRTRPEEALARFPQYALELGFRCVATATRRGRALLAYERAEEPRDRLQVLEYSFGADIAGYAEELAQRRRGYETALERRTPGSLPACPAWMFPSCPYREGCGCGETDRSQR